MEQEIKVICAWCPDFDPKDPRNATASHGMCPSCVAKFEADWVRDASGRAVAPPQEEPVARPAGPWDSNSKQ